MIEHIENWRCWFRHEWEHDMETLQPRKVVSDPAPVLVGWKWCRRCGASKITLVCR